MYKELKENIIKFYLLEFELRFKGDSKEVEQFINKVITFGEILGQIKHHESGQE